MELTGGRGDVSPARKSMGGCMARTREKSKGWEEETRILIRDNAGVGSCCSEGNKAESRLSRASRCGSCIASRICQYLAFRVVWHHVHSCRRG